MRVDAHSQAAEDAVRAVLELFPKTAITLMREAGCSVVVLGERETYRQRSPALSRLTRNVDDWPVPPAGLFVIEERTLYLRSISAMAVAHELGHALDLALGGGVYLSSLDATVRGAFRDARAFVTPYAAAGLDEYFAECVRAYVEVNDERSPWPAATRARLKLIDATMHDFIAAACGDPIETHDEAGAR